MFTRDLSLEDLETLLHGYCSCLRVNKITEVYEGRMFSPADFSVWLHSATGWSAALGFAAAIEENTAGAEGAWSMFFKFVQQYRNASGVGSAELL